MWALEGWLDTRRNLQVLPYDVGNNDLTFYWGVINYLRERWACSAVWAKSLLLLRALTAEPATRLIFCWPTCGFVNKLSQLQFRRRPSSKTVSEQKRNVRLLAMNNYSLLQKWWASPQIIRWISVQPSFSQRRVQNGCGLPGCDKVKNATLSLHIGSKVLLTLRARRCI